MLIDWRVYLVYVVWFKAIAACNQHRMASNRRLGSSQREVGKF